MLLWLAVGAGCAGDPARDTESVVVAGQVAPRLMNVGDHRHPITTSSPRAQLFFDQGLNLAYGFNHREAGRAFGEAARLDPDCAMCFWGQALVLGPNINAAMRPQDEPAAHALVQQAQRRAAGASPRERAYIEALAKRYSGAAAPDRAAQDRAYADAMRELHRAYPDDLDAATLFAESLMDLRPWDYWQPDGSPYPGTQELVAALESVIQRDPDHPGANHLYIHAMEATQPQRAVQAADRLRDAAPAAGHLQHMPSHIYVRVGRYADATLANEKAVAADEDYIAQCRAQGIYPLAYYPHNLHFLWLSTAWEGRSADSFAAADAVAAKSRDHLDELPSWAQVFPAVPLFARARFGRWGWILEQPEPPASHPYWRGIWHYARGLARARQGALPEARAELGRVRALAADPAVSDTIVGGNPAGTLLELAGHVLAGEIAAEAGDTQTAVRELRDAVKREDSLAYIEPPDWSQPARQSLGAVLLEAGRADEAEAVYREDLERHPENGWSLFGLAEALRAQGRSAEAARVERRFETAWRAADVQLSSSRF